MTVKEKLMGVSKTKKMMIAGVAVLLVGGIGGTVYASNQSQQKIVAEKQETLDTTTTKLADLNKKVQTLFDSKDSNFLAKGVTEQQINELKDQLAKDTKAVTNDTTADSKVNSSGYDKVKTDVASLLNKAELLGMSQSAINGLFTETKEAQALNGTDVKKDLPITNDLTQATLDELKKDIEAVKEPTSFDKTCLDLIKVAEDQVTQITKAKTEVAKVFKDGKVTSTDKNSYDTAKKEVDKIKNAKAKKDLSEQLAKVKTDIDKKEKAETDKKAEASNTETKAENKATADATQANQQADNGSTGGATASNQDTETGGNADNGYTPTYDGNQGTDGGNTGGGGYTPPTDNGSTGGGSSNGGNQGGSGSNGGGSTSPSNTLDPMTPVGSGGLFGSYDQAYSTGMAEALRLKKQDGVTRQVQVDEVKYTDGRSAGWTYYLV